MKKTYKVKNYKGNLVESLKKFSDSYKDMKIVHAYVDGDSNLKIKAEKIVNESFDDKHPKTAYTVRNNTRTFSHSDQPKEYGTYRTEEDAEKMRQWLARKDPSWRLENTEVVPKELDPMLPVHWTDVDGLENDEENAEESISESVFDVYDEYHKKLEAMKAHCEQLLIYLDKAKQAVNKSKRTADDQGNIDIFNSLQKTFLMKLENTLQFVNDNNLLDH